jgi:hypothetical protein
MLTAFVLALGVAVLVPHAARASTNPVTAGDSQTNCFVLTGGTYGEISTANLASVESTTGMTVNCLETFNNPAATWDAWDAPWQFTNGQPSGTESWNNWVAAGNSMILGEDLIPQAVDSGNWEASCAAGNYDSYATTLAQNLISYGAGNITIRLGIEANGNWETDYVGTNPSAWATCYDNEVSAMRAVSGAHFLFVWNPNACYSDAASGGDLSSWYPGNSYVDIIAADDYDTDCTNSDTVAQEGFSAYASNGSPSLDSIQSFAESNGKPLAIPEWGLESGDDPAYVNGISSVLHSTTSGWSFQSYFDDGDGAQELTSTYPNSVAAYQSGFADSGSTTPPAAPAKLQASVNGDSVTLSWSPVSGATSYEVRVSGYAIQVVTMSDGVYADDTTTTPSLTLNNLPTTGGNGGDYWWGVAAVNSAGKTWDAQTAAGNANEFVVS